MNLKLTVALAAVLTFNAYAAEPMLADRHVAKGVQCAMCHGPDEKNLQEPTADTCKQCHSVDALVEKTAKVKPTNPHTSPHYATDLDCNSCHLGHQSGENFCNQCHQFDFKVR